MWCSQVANRSQTCHRCLDNSDTSLTGAVKAAPLGAPRSGCGLYREDEHPKSGWRKWRGAFFLPFSPHWKRGLLSPLLPSLGAFVRCDNVPMPQGHKRRKGQHGLTDEAVRAILVQSMADVGADPALVYAFQKTGVYVCDENENRLPKEKLKAFDGAVDEYFAALKRPAQ